MSPCFRYRLLALCYRMRPFCTMSGTVLRAQFGTDLAHGTLAVRFWTRATPKSKGMPANFYPTFHIFSSLAPALVLLDWNEPNPELEAWMMAQVRFRARRNQMPKAAIPYRLFQERGLLI